MKLRAFTGPEVKAIRQKLRMNQAEFWQHFQVTQSGGSRYASGRDIPDPVQVLLNSALGGEKASEAIVAGLRALRK